MTKDRRKRICIALATMLLILGVFVTGRALPLGEWLGKLNVWTNDKCFSGILTFCSTYILAVLLLLPSSVFTMSAGVTYGLLEGTVISLFSATAAAAIAFLVSRHWGHARVQFLLNRNPKLQAIDRAITEHGWKIVFLSRLVPFVPFGPVNYTLGLSRVSFRTYIGATALGLVPGTFLYTYAGYAGYTLFRGGEPRSGLQYMLIMGGLLLVIAFAFFLGRIAKRALNDIEHRTN